MQTVAQHTVLSRLRRSGIALVFVVAGSMAHANNTDDINRLLTSAKAPPGVVFEVVSGQDHALSWAVPAVNRYVQRLRARFPGLPIAVVTHGSEQFALTRANRAQHGSVHEQIRQMTREQNIDVHVCGTHAGWRNLEAEDFPDYVNVAAVGPVAIKNYQELGYHLIVVRQP